MHVLGQLFDTAGQATDVFGRRHAQAIQRTGDAILEHLLQFVDGLRGLVADYACLLDCGLLGAAYPAWLATRKDPVEALAFE